MSKKVNWFVIEEEWSIGFAGDIFITEESIRYDAPRVMIHDSLYEAVEWVYGEPDEDDEGMFKDELENAREAYNKAKCRVVMRQFMKKMGEKFSAYKEQGIMESYVCDLDKGEMWLSKEDYDRDQGYLWSALDGALLLWNDQYAPYAVYVEEYAPDAKGMIKYEFNCELD